jgi:hypothetical protein
MRAPVLVAIVAAAGLTGCLRTVGYRCNRDGECTQSGMTGVCESVGYCSFADGSCADGRRFDSLGGPYANQCVGDNLGDAGPMDAAKDAAPDSIVRGPPPTGAALWLRLDDDPADGVADSAGTHLVSCVGPCPTLTAGTVDSAYKFQSNQLFTGGTADLLPNTGFTVSAWARLDAVPTTPYADIVCKQVGTIEASYCLTFRQNLHADFYTPTRDLDAPAVTVLGTWHHYAMTWDGVTKRGYVDGQQVGSAAILSISSDSGGFLIGSAQVTPTYLLNGAIDDVFFYDRALTANEVVALMNHN